MARTTTSGRAGRRSITQCLASRRTHRSGPEGSGSVSQLAALSMARE